MSQVLPELFAAAVRRDGASPFLTYYDDQTGERIELSAVTTANWVAKTANLLVDGHGLRGDRVGLLLPLHWQVVCFLLGTATAGSRRTPGASTAATVWPTSATASWSTAGTT